MIRVSYAERRASIRAMVIAGESNKYIALSIGCTIGTVYLHILRMKHEIGVADRVELISALARKPCEEMPRLTPSLDAVARSIFAGHTNREIARRRSVSERTVANQVARIFARLGIRSRADLAVRYEPPSEMRDSRCALRHEDA